VLVPETEDLIFQLIKKVMYFIRNSIKENSCNLCQIILNSNLFSNWGKVTEFYKFRSVIFTDCTSIEITDFSSGTW